MYPHLSGNIFSLGENIPQVHGAQHISQRGGSQQPCRATVVVHIRHGVDSIGHFVVEDGIHEHRHTVLGQYLNQDIVSKEGRKGITSCGGISKV